MIHNIQIHDICRTERYYTATLLPYVLLHENFAGLRAFLRLLGEKNIRARAVETGAPAALDGGSPFAHVELISEMDLVRDLHFYAPWLAGMEDVRVQEADSLRPDVVIVADRLLLVVEAKFFHDSLSPDTIRTQLQGQRRVIANVLLRFPGYSFDRYCHLFLSAAPAPAADVIGCQGVLYWEEMRQLAQQVLGNDHYVTQRLTRATEMYRLVTVPAARGNGQHMRNYRGILGRGEMVEKCRQEGNGVMVGYCGGAAKLQARAPEDLQSRRFKWDRADDPLPPKVPCNWMLGARFLELMTAKFPDSMDFPRN
jgi:hypothetical protein